MERSLPGEKYFYVPATRDQGSIVTSHSSQQVSNSRRRNLTFSKNLILDFYQSIEKESQAEFKDRGSRFIAYARPISDQADFKSFLQRLKKEHPKAVHHCFAYRLGLDGNQFRSSDDGEPAGSAGRPILGQIDSKGLTDVCVVVVRYFGGTLLGVPGLINAYKTVAALALQVVPIIQKPVLRNFQLEFDYTRLNEVQVLIKQMQGQVLRQEQMLFCTITVGIPKSRVDEFVYKLRELHNVHIR